MKIIADISSSNWRNKCVILAVLACFSSVGCATMPQSPTTSPKPIVSVDLSTHVLDIAIPKHGSKDFPNAAARPARLNDAAAYDEWGLQVILERYLDYKPSFIGVPKGTLRFAISVRLVSDEDELNVNDLAAAKSIVEKHSVERAAAFALRLKRKGFGTINGNMPTGFRVERKGKSEWIRFETRGSDTTVFTRPLDSQHLLELTFTFTRNSNDDSWLVPAKDDVERIVETMVIRRK